MLPQLAALSRPELLRSLSGRGEDRPTVLTPNARLARALRADFDRARAAAGETVWETADILPLGAFVARLWEEALHSPRGARVPLLLTPAQELAAWDEAVRESAVDDLVFSAAAAAGQCREAWQVTHAWRVDVRRAGPLGEDATAWLGWSARYERSTRGQTDAARLPDVVAQGLDLGTPKPAVVALAGFDIVTPQAAAFLSALAAAGSKLVRVESADVIGQAARVELTRAEDEIDAAARWARARLEAQPSSRIGIVVPDLARRRSRIHRVLADTLVPGHRLEPAPSLPFNLSLGAPLADVPVVADALLLLALAGPNVAFEQASRLLRSPFVGGAEAEMESRARLDAWLRERCGPRIALDALLRLARSSRLAAPRLIERLEALSRARKDTLFGAKGAAQWAKAFSEALRAAGFPGERTLDSAEHQALERWHELLAELASLERVTGKMNFADATRRLARMAGDAVFQPEGGEAPVQVMGVLESAGLEFDHLWVMGLTDDAWPLPARPSALLPVRAQRLAGVPQADPRTSLELDRRITAGWLRSAREVVFSHARAAGESELAASPLIAQVPAATLEAIGLPRFPTLRDAIRQAVRTERIEDARAPAIASPEQPGGTGLFRDQAACPFRAYARRRVGSRPLETPRIGLDARARGVLLHDVLADVWKALGHRDALLAKSPAERGDLVARAVDAAVAKMRGKRGDALAGRFERLERERLAGLALAWLDLEARRDDFTVLEAEEKHPLTFGGVTVSARLDRMDAIARGRAIIDYKTGACATGSWLGERPDEPQMPMYALAAPDVAVVAFGQVKAGEMQFRGLAREKDLLPGANLVTEDRSRAARSYRGWDELVAGWRRELESLGAAFAAGDARVDPKRGPLTCETCDQHTFCRIAEKAAFGVRKGGAEDE